MAEEPISDRWRRAEGSRPLIIAHRGARVAAPENTLAAFAEAIAVGAEAIELDVYLCASGEVVVVHDAAVDRTTDGSGQVEALELQALRRLDAGSWFAARFAGERIPTLDEVLDLVGHKVLLNVEIKGSDASREALVRAVVASVRSREGLAERVLISSFSVQALRQTRALAPEIHLALLFGAGQPLESAYAQAQALQALALHPHYTLVNPEMLAEARGYGYLVNAWTVNDPAEMLRLGHWGVNGIITDDPALLREVLDASGLTETQEVPREDGE